MINYFWLVAFPKLGWLLASFGVAGIALAAANLMINEEHSEKSIQFSCITFIIGLIMWIVGVFIPTKQEIIQIKTLSIVSEIKGVGQIPQRLVAKLNELLGDKDE